MSASPNEPTVRQHLDAVITARETVSDWDSRGEQDPLDLWHQMAALLAAYDFMAGRLAMLAAGVEPER